MNLSNQELLNELNKRIKAGEIKHEMVIDEVSSETKSLLAGLDGKSLLLLFGMVTVFTLLFLYSIKQTSSLPTGATIEFDCNPLTNVKVPVATNNES